MMGLQNILRWLVEEADTSQFIAAIALFVASGTVFSFVASYVGVSLLLGL